MGPVRAALAAVLALSVPALWAETVDVTILDNAFVPAEITIQAGDSVRWTNTQGSHSATADDGSFDSGILGTTPPNTFTFQFDSAGTVPYYCIIHSFPGGTRMNGRVVVLARVELSHGFRQVQGFLPLVADSAVRTFRIGQEPYSSYEVVVDSTSGDAGSGIALERLSSDGATVLQDSVPAGSVGFSRSLRWSNGTASTVVDELVRVRSTSCTLANCGPEDVFRVLAYDTTYLAPRFNNSASQVTVLVVQNPTSNPVTGTAYFWAVNGTLAGSQGFSLAPEGLLAMNTASVAGVGGQSGSITITNDARYGELLGKSISVEPATGFTFDTALTSRPR